MSPAATAGPLAIKYQDLTKQLREAPGETMFVRTAPTLNSAWATAQAIKSGRRAAFRPHGHYHAHTNGLDVYATYIGDGACHGGTLAPGAYCTICGTANPEGK